MAGFTASRRVHLYYGASLLLLALVACRGSDGRGHGVASPPSTDPGSAEIERARAALARLQPELRDHSSLQFVKAILEQPTLYGPLGAVGCVVRFDADGTPLSGQTLATVEYHKAERRSVRRLTPDELRDHADALRRQWEYQRARTPDLDTFPVFSRSLQRAAAEAFLSESDASYAFGRGEGDYSEELQISKRTPAGWAVIAADALYAHAR